MAGPMRTVRRSSLCILGKLTLITLIGSAGAQSYGPGYNGGRPVSATINDISGQDPAGRNALVVSMLVLACSEPRCVFDKQDLMDEGQ